MGGGIQQKDADLAVLAPPGCPAVLPRHPCRLLSLLDEPCLIEDQDPVCFCQVLGDVGPQVITHGLLIPVRLPQQPLHPTRSVLCPCFGHLPAVLALHGRQQSFQEAPRPPAHLGSLKARPDALLYFSQRLGSCAHDPEFVLFVFVMSFFCGHLLHPSEAFYHVWALSVTVVLGVVRK